MIDIQQRLQTIFETQRLVFWYDEGALLREEFESLSLDSVTKLEIDNDEFTIKRQVLKLQPTDRFLLYAPTAIPSDEENWLLDLNIANYLFAADKTSLILQNIGLDVGFKNFVDRFDKFFNAPKRVESLRMIIGSKETDDTLALKMMAISIGSDHHIDSIMLRVFESDKHFETLVKYNLSELFFEAIKKKYTYEGDTLKDLLYKLFQNHFYAHLDRSKCPLNHEAKLFVDSWMDSSRHKKSFLSHSVQVSQELNIDTIMIELDTTKIITCDTYEKCDKMVITHLLEKLHSDAIHADETADIIALREHTFWYEGYKNIYRALGSASLLFDFVKETAFEMESFEEGIASYSAHWYKGDRYYRDYSLYASKAEHLELLKELSIMIEDIYLNGFLRVLNDKWQSFADDYTTQTTHLHQQNFYQEKVEALLSKKQKVFVIISDALRYECGKELSSKIVSIDKYTSSCDFMVSSAPSYTQLGMASLLPHKELSIKEKNDTVFIDGKSTSGMLNRDKVLKSYNPDASAIGYEKFIKFSRDEGREFVKGSSVIYIYHDEIDKMGEKNEIKTFDAVLSTFETISKIVKQVSNFNGANIFITSDHGFLYTNNPTLESEFCKVDSSGSIKLNRRFVIGKKLKNSSCTTKYSGVDLGIKGENEFLIAKSLNKIRVQGGGNRFVHGGTTLQELVIPLIQIKKKRATDVKDVDVAIIPIRNISTNSVNISAYQSQIVDEKIKPLTLKIAFESSDGVLLSDIVKHTFDSKEVHDTNRETKFRLTFKQDINTYNNQTIKLTMRKVLAESNETPLYKTMDVKLALSFFNDFDDDF
jgi:uncharacterized protein (TIGR02687 family)